MITITVKERNKKKYVKEFENVNDAFEFLLKLKNVSAEVVSEQELEEIEK